MGIRQELLSGSQLITNTQITISGVNGEAISSGSITVPRTFVFKKVANSAPIRTRLYGTAAGREADKARAATDSAYISVNVASASLLVEVMDEAGLEVPINGRLFGANTEYPSQSVIYYTVQPSGSATFTGNVTQSIFSIYGLEDLTPRERISLTTDFQIASKVRTGSLATPNSYLILVTSSSHASTRFRLYQDQYARNADLSRPFTTPISSSGISGSGITTYTGSGLIIDVAFDNAGSQSVTPIVIGDLLTSNDLSYYTFEYTGSLGAGISSSVYMDLFALEE
jgi:hypothetical protein